MTNHFKNLFSETYFNQTNFTFNIGLKLLGTEEQGKKFLKEGIVTLVYTIFSNTKLTYIILITFTRVKNFLSSGILFIV